MSENTLTRLESGFPILYRGNRIAHITAETAERFREGDRLVVVQESGDILHIPKTEFDIAADAVGRAVGAFGEMARVTDDAVTRFYDAFSIRLEEDRSWEAIAAANSVDVDHAKSIGRSTTRLIATDKMRKAMVAGLREWRDAAPVRGRTLETIAHNGWSVEQQMAPLGVVGFVFEGRPNVFADATGVLRGGNTVVFRIGSDALRTAKAIVENALRPALAETGLPEGAVVLLESSAHAAGWALFSDSRLSLAVARGSGRAVAQLGSVARQSGIPVSLHGTGGAWIVADEPSTPSKLAAAIFHSLDRKVCNTLNVLCLPRQGTDLIAAFRDSVMSAGARDDRGVKVHVVTGDEAAVPSEWFSKAIGVRRATGLFQEPMAEPMAIDDLGREWEWEETPEISVKLVDSVDEAAALFNHYSPQFVASLITDDEARLKRFFDSVNAPFVGNGFTRWVDGQYALNRPELGLSNWQLGRLFARGAVLSGDGIYTVRTKVVQADPEVHR